MSQPFKENLFNLKKVPNSILMDVDQVIIEYCCESVTSLFYMAGHLKLQCKSSTKISSFQGFQHKWVFVCKTCNSVEFRATEFRVQTRQNSYILQSVTKKLIQAIFKNKFWFFSAMRTERTSFITKQQMKKNLFIVYLLTQQFMQLS